MVPHVLSLDMGPISGHGDTRIAVAAPSPHAQALTGSISRVLISQGRSGV